MYILLPVHDPSVCSCTVKRGAVVALGSISLVMKFLIHKSIKVLYFIFFNQSEKNTPHMVSSFCFFPTYVTQRKSPPSLNIFYRTHYSTVTYTTVCDCVHARDHVLLLQYIIIVVCITKFRIFTENFPLSRIIYSYSMCMILMPYKLCFSSTNLCTLTYEIRFKTHATTTTSNSAAQIIDVG